MGWGAKKRLRRLEAAKTNVEVKSTKATKKTANKK